MICLGSPCAAVLRQEVPGSPAAQYLGATHSGLNDCRATAWRGQEAQEAQVEPVLVKLFLVLWILDWKLNQPHWLQISWYILIISCLWDHRWSLHNGNCDAGTTARAIDPDRQCLKPGRLTGLCKMRHRHHRPIRTWGFLEMGQVTMAFDTKVV